MGKQQYLLSEFKGLDASAKSPNSPMWLQGARADVDDSVLVPENDDVVTSHSDSLGNCYIQRKKIYVDGVERELAITDRGSVMIDDEVIGTIDPGNLAVDVIGRQAIMSHGGYARFLRVGYPGKGFIPFSNDEIVMENDYINSSTSSFTSVKDVIPLSDTSAIALIRGRTQLTKFSLSEGVATQEDSYAITSSEIIAITHDVDASGDIKYIYCAYYDDGQIRIKRFTVAEDFDAEANVSAGTVVLQDAENYFARGYVLKDIAKTENKIFISFYKPSGDTAEILGPERGEIAEDQDLLFAFTDTNINWEASTIITTTITTTDNTLARSMLPWNPYREASFNFRILNGVIAPGTINNGNPGTMYIPHETNIGEGVEENHPDFLKSFRLHDMLKAYTSPISSSDPPVMPSPGACGVVGYIRPIGDLVVLSYANDCVGYFVYADGSAKAIKSRAQSEEGFQLGTTNGYRSNGAGYAKITVSSGGKRHCIGGTALPPDDDTGKDPIMMQRKIALYCWNGVYKGDAVYTYRVSNDWDVSIDRFFDDANTRIGYESRTHARFLILSETALANGVEPTGLNWAPVMHGGTIDSIISTTDNPPALMSMYLNSGGSTDVLFVPYCWQNRGIMEAGLHSKEPVVEGTSSFCKAYSLSSRITFRDAKSIIDIEPINGWTYINDLTGVSQSSGSSSYVYTQAGLNAEAYTDGSGYDAGAVVRMKIAFVFDGVSVSPLSDSYVEITDDNAAFDIKYTLSFDLSDLRGISKRITSINVYSAIYSGGEALELYRLVKSFPLTNENFFLNDSGVYETGHQYDTNARLASFNTDSGYSETVDTVSLARRLQCACQNYLFVGDVDIHSRNFSGVNTSNLVVRSLPFQPSVFNYQEDFVVLAFTPTALVAHNNRIYAFGSDCYSIINPDTLGVEHTSYSCGAANKNHVTVCDFGVFVFYAKNVYHIDGQRITPIGEPIRSINNSVEATNFTVNKSLVAAHPKSLSSVYGTYLFIEYLPSKQEIVVVFRSGLTSIGMFAYCIPRNKWSFYWVKPPVKPPISIGRIRIMSVYRYEESVYVVYRDNATNQRYTVNIFNADTKRVAVAMWDIKTGNDRQVTTLYNGTVTKDGNAVSCALYGWLTKTNEQKYMERLNLDKASKTNCTQLTAILVTTNPVDRIGITHRTKVTK